MIETVVSVLSLIMYVTVLTCGLLEDTIDTVGL